MSLMVTPQLDTYVDSPGEMESMRALREEGKRNWDQYTATGGHPEGHLLLYPFEVSGFLPVCVPGFKKKYPIS